MAQSRIFRRSPFGRDCLPLDSARTAFEWLVTGPDPVSIQGWRFPGLPRRWVALDELRDLLLDAELPMSTVDPVWVHLVARSRDEGGTWTVGCVGVALPALLSIAAELSAPFADDHRDIHAAVLGGFLSELASMDLAKPWVMWRLRCAALRAGHLFIRDALERPMPTGEDFHSREPSPPWGHPDFVLARAVADGMDVLKVYQTASAAVDHARSQQDPFLVECVTYRFRGHSMSDPQRYRSREEVSKWRERDPIMRFQAQLQEEGQSLTHVAAGAQAQAGHHDPAAAEPGQQELGDAPHRQPQEHDAALNGGAFHVQSVAEEGCLLRGQPVEAG